MLTLNHSVSGGNLSLYVGSPCDSTCMCTSVVFVPAYRMMAPTIKPEVVKETVDNTNLFEEIKKASNFLKTSANATTVVCN